MHAPERLPVEAGLQFVECPEIRRPCDRARHDGNHIIDQRRVDHVVGLDEQEAFSNPDRQLLAPRLAPLHQLDDALQIRVRQGRAS